VNFQDLDKRAEKWRVNLRINMGPQTQVAVLPPYGKKKDGRLTCRLYHTLKG
jgi:hypothetical protein